jgi:putative FmdB family regulatory protein
MPLYDYQCQACGYVFEVRASFKEKENGLHPICPSCESVQTQQMLSAPMVILSGVDAGAPLPSRGCGPNAGPGCCSM